MFYPWKQNKNNLEILWLLWENDRIKNECLNWEEMFQKSKCQGLKEKKILAL